MNWPKHPATVHRRLFLETDKTLILGANLLPLPPLPVVVAIIIDLLDRNRRFARDVIREIVWSLFDRPFAPLGWDCTDIQQELSATREPKLANFQ
jgi:hypothetical protein